MPEVLCNIGTNGPWTIDNHTLYISNSLFSSKIIRHTVIWKSKTIGIKSRSGNTTEWVERYNHQFKCFGRFLLKNNIAILNIPSNKIQYFRQIAIAIDITEMMFYQFTQENPAFGANSDTQIFILRGTH